MYHAAMSGDWKTAADVISEFPNILRTQITEMEDTALQIAAARGQKYFVQKLVEIMEEDDLLLQNKGFYTALALAAVTGATEIAKVLVNRNPRALLMSNAYSMLPIHSAAFFGHQKMVSYLYWKTNLEEMTRYQRIRLFHFLVYSEVYDKALDMLLADKSLALPWGRYGGRALNMLARRPSAISREPRLGFFTGLIHSSCGGIFHKAWMRTVAHQLVEELWMVVIESQYGEITYLKSNHIRMLFDAAEVGNVEFIVILYRSFPVLGAGTVAGDIQSLFHVAAINRQENVFNLIYELGTSRTLFAIFKTSNTGNTMLHLVAALPTSKQLKVVSGPALQLQRELLWFEAVQNITPVHLVEQKNREGKLAHEIFTEHHKELQMRGEKWMKETATSCMVVATLITTVAFAAAFTVPGGNDQKTGIPIFKGRGWFDIFAVSNAIALCTSVLSSLFFLSILTSRYAESDFRRSLPLKLTIGLLLLAISVSAMLLAFSASFFLNYSTYKKSSYHGDHSWIPIVTLSLALGISFLYCLLHGHLLFDTIKQTIWSNVMFQPWTGRLYPRWLCFQRFTQC